MAQIDDVAARCGYAGYVDSYLTYPPRGPLPLPGNSTIYDDGCNVWQMILDAALIVNPGFNYYRIFDNVRTPLIKSLADTRLTPRR